VFGRALERVKTAALYGDFDWSRSTAYAHMQPALRLNLAGREPKGIVTVERRADVCGELAEAAAALHLPGGPPVFTGVTPSDQVYAGDAPDGPDLVLDLAPGMHIKSRNTTGKAGHLRRLRDLGIYMPSGVHSPRGMFAASGRGIDQAGRVEDADIHQVAPSLLAILGVPAPPLDADPFAFVREVVKRVDDPGARAAVARAAPPDAAAGVSSANGDLSEEEEAQVLERLRGLGYVD